MVDISNKLDKISVLVEKGKYFTINWARQYGKTTTIKFLEQKLKEKYIVIRTTFEGLDDYVFENAKNFNKSLAGKLSLILKEQGISSEIINDLQNDSESLNSIEDLGNKITELCENVLKPVVLIIDEVDKISILIPIINGVGFYFIDPKTRNDKRMDIILTYGNEKFIFELKIWYGDKKHELAYKQLADYLSIQGMNMGYLLTFDFRESKETRYEWIEFDDRKIMDVIV